MPPRVGWGHVIAILDKYISLRADWPITSPIGRLDDVQPEGVNRDISGSLEWVSDIGCCLAKLTSGECECVLGAAMVRQAEAHAAVNARNAETFARRSGTVPDIRDSWRRTKNDWMRLAAEHQRTLRELEHRGDYKRGMDRLSALIVTVARAS
jgi:hypothetical protein